MNKSPLLSEVAIERLANWAFNISDPDEMLRRIGISRYQLKSLESDDEITQCKQTRFDAIKSVDWHLEPGTGKAYKFAKAILDKHVQTLLTGCMEAVPYGYSVQETIYEMDKSMVVPVRVSLKPMQWFRPQKDGTLRYFPTDARYSVEGVLCDPRKFLFTVVNGTYDNPMGDALLSRLWFPANWRQEGNMLWLSYMETFAQPIVLGKVSNFKAFVEAMQQQGIRSAIGWQSSMSQDEITTISASGPGEFERLENALVRRIQKAWLGQAMTAQAPSDGGGSYAMAAAGLKVLDTKLLSDIRLCQPKIQEWLNHILEINGMQSVKFVIANEAGLEQARATRDAMLFPVLSNSGLRHSKQYFLNAYDYKEGDLEEKPEPEEPEDDPGDEVVDPEAGKEKVGKRNGSSGKNKATGKQKEPTQNRSEAD